MTGPIAVTGAGGYLGGRLLQHLRCAGSEVRGLTRNPVPWLPGLVPIDLAAASTHEIAEVLAGCESVVHLAGANEVATTDDPDGALATTSSAARRTAAAADAAGVQRYVYLSTVHVYGAAMDDADVLDESVLPQPRHPYAIARLAGEHLSAAADLPLLVVLRLTNSVGAPIDAKVDRWSLVANELCAQAAKGGPLVLRSSGHQWRDFIDVGDVCRAIGDAAVGRVPADTYNLGSGTPRTVLELANMIADQAGLDGPRPEVMAPRHEGAEPRRTSIDTSRLSAHISAPRTPLESSVRELIELCRDAGRAGEDALGH